MYRADRGRMHIRIEPRQLLYDLRCAPVRFVVLEAHDPRLDLDPQLVGMPIRPARAVSEPIGADHVVSGEDFVTGRAGDAELVILSPCSSKAINLSRSIHRITLLPRHFCSPRKRPGV